MRMNIGGWRSGIKVSKLAVSRLGRRFGCEAGASRGFDELAVRDSDARRSAKGIHSLSWTDEVGSVETKLSGGVTCL